MGKLKRRYDGYVEKDTKRYPIDVKKFQESGDSKEWICLAEDVFKEVVSGKIHIEERLKSESPIMEFKQRPQDNRIRSSISDNLYEAIRKRTTDESREQYLLKIAKFYGYTTTKSIKNAYRLKSPIPLHAEDILNLEKHFGIHRDEILGEINKEGLSNIRSLQRLYAYMKKDDELHRKISDVINAMCELMFRESVKNRNAQGMQPEEKACEKIKLFIQGL